MADESSVPDPFATCEVLHAQDFRTALRPGTEGATHFSHTGKIPCRCAPNVFGRELHPGSPIAWLKKLIVVTGSEGGVGTTTVALNVAVQLAQLTAKRNALLEFARPFGQIGLMLDFHTRFTLLDALERVDRLDESLLASLFTRHKSGIELLAGPLHAALRAEQRQSVALEALLRILELARGAFDFVVVDLGFVNAVEWSRLLHAADTLLLIAEPSALALGMLERYLHAVDSAGLDRASFQIIINRARRSNDEPVVQSEKILNQSFFARLPNDFRQVSEAVTRTFRSPPLPTMP